MGSSFAATRIHLPPTPGNSPQRHAGRARYAAAAPHQARLTAKERDRRTRKEQLKLVLRQMLGIGGGSGGGAAYREGRGRAQEGLGLDALRSRLRAVAGGGDEVERDQGGEGPQRQTAGPPSGQAAPARRPVPVGRWRSAWLTEQPTGGKHQPHAAVPGGDDADAVAAQEAAVASIVSADAARARDAAWSRQLGALESQLGRLLTVLDKQVGMERLVWKGKTCRNGSVR